MLRPGARFDYERSLRPVMTQALALDADGGGRLALATAYGQTRVFEIRNGALAPEASGPAFGDPVTSDAYLRRVRGVLLARQIERMGAA